MSPTPTKKTTESEWAVIWWFTISGLLLVSLILFFLGLTSTADEQIIDKAFYYAWITLGLSLGLLLVRILIRKLL